MWTCSFMCNMRLWQVTADSNSVMIKDNGRILGTSVELRNEIICEPKFSKNMIINRFQMFTNWDINALKFKENMGLNPFINKYSYCICLGLRFNVIKNEK